MDDAELLRRYAVDRSEEAFAELVRRHVHFVFGAAQRKLGGDVHLAEDVVQQVFIALARQSGSLARQPCVLAGWLYGVTRNAAAQVVRAERRRAAREREALVRDEMLRDDTARANWEQARPALDAALAGLRPRDRDAVILRFFERCTYAEIGRRMSVSGDAARLRIERGLERMRRTLVRQGISSTQAAVAALLTTEAAVCAPAALAGSVSAAAIAAASGGAGAIAGASGIATLIHFMSANKAAAAVAVVALSIGTGGVILRHRADAAFAREAATLRNVKDECSRLEKEDASLAKTLRSQQTTAEWNLAHNGMIDRMPKVSADVAALRKELDAVRAKEKRSSSSALSPHATAELAELGSLVAAKNWDAAVALVSKLAASAPAGSFDSYTAADTLGKLYWQGEYNLTAAREWFETAIDILADHPAYAEPSSPHDLIERQYWLMEINYALAQNNARATGADPSGKQAGAPDQWFPGGAD